MPQPASVTSTARRGTWRDDYAPDPPGSPGPARDLTRGSVKYGTCPPASSPAPFSSAAGYEAAAAS